jgi:hypothetical protein
MRGLLSSRLWVAGLVICLSLVATASFGVAQALGTCVEDGSLFWGDSGAGYTSSGTQQDLVVRSHSSVYSGCATNGTVAGGTAHMSPLNGGGSLVEAGWRDLTDGSGNHYFRLFTESCFTVGGCSVVLKSSSCASAGTTVSIRVTSFGGSSYIWYYYYACNGGGFTSLGDSGSAEGWNHANDRVETFRFGAPGWNAFVLDYHNALKHYNSGGTLINNMGTLVCDQGMTGTFGVPNGSPATSWQTASSGSC